MCLVYHPVGLQILIFASSQPNQPRHHPDNSATGCSCDQSKARTFIRSQQPHFEAPSYALEAQSMFRVERSKQLYARRPKSHNDVPTQNIYFEALLFSGRVHVTQYNVLKV
jgi:hypothetical protein